MPTYRLIHEHASQSERVNAFDHVQYRAWHQYLLSADDFGVCVDDPARLQTDNRWLKMQPVRKVASAIAALVAVDLARRFIHQGQSYLYQWDWQDWQRIKYPSRTIYPAIPGELLEKCSTKTIALFVEFHPKLSPTFTPRARPRNANAKATADVGSWWEAWREVVERCTGSPPVLTASARDWEHLQALLGSGYAPDHLLACAELMLQSPSFRGKNRGLGMLRANVAELDAWMREHPGVPFGERRHYRRDVPNAGGQCPHEPECRSISACTARTLEDGRLARAAQAETA